ncbi:MAG: hypothetical protein P8J33_07135 [Pirellulaceae bacterium]|nr:hypothetical protein [Pirellulaceae bacterium]
MPSDEWLIRLMLLIDIAMVISVSLTVYFSFPKLISEMLTANRMRLDGTISADRSELESTALSRWRNNVIFWGLISLLLANAAIFACHRFIMPIPIAAAGLEVINANPTKWKTNLEDPQKGSVLSDLEAWQIRKGRKPSLKLMPTFYMAYGMTFVLILAAAGALIRAYIFSLVKLAKQAEKRKQDYLMHDMKSRLDAVEAAD